MIKETDIIDIALPDGFGVARLDNRVIFVNDAVTGDKIELDVTKEKKNFSYGRIKKMLSESTLRQKPFCPYFGVCGGCSLQSFSYEKQLQLKHSYLIETLKRIGKINLDDVKIYPMESSPQTQYFRNKVELISGGGKSGFYKRSSKEIAAVEYCPVSIKLLEQVLQISGSVVFKQLVVREGKTTGDLMIVIVSDELSETDLSGFVMDINNLKVKNSIYRAKPSKKQADGDFVNPKLVSGQAYIEESLCGKNFRIYPQTFFQTNTLAAELLYKRIIDFVKIVKPESAAGLYCGCGAIEIVLSEHVNKVTGIDSGSVNIKNAAENSLINNAENCSFIEGSVEKVFGMQPKSGLLIINPPRNGISDVAMKLILNSETPNLIYVSCSPPTLARDINIFSQKGYKVTAVSAFDMFPHTGHMETVVLMRK